MSACWHYMELTLLSRDQRGAYVEWHDGTRERIRVPTDRPLLACALKSRLGVWVQLDSDGKVCCMRGDVTPLP